MFVSFSVLNISTEQFEFGDIIVSDTLSNKPDLQWRAAFNMLWIKILV